MVLVAVEHPGAHSTRHNSGDWFLPPTADSSFIFLTFSSCYTSLCSRFSQQCLLLLSPPLHVSLMSPYQTVQPLPLHAPFIPQHLPGCSQGQAALQHHAAVLTALWARRHGGVKVRRALGSFQLLLSCSKVAASGARKRKH